MAVAIHQRAFKDFFLTFLGPSFLRLLYRFYVYGETEIAIAGEHNGRLIATLLGTRQPEGFYRRLTRKYSFMFACASLIPLLKRPTIFPRLIRALLYRGDTPSQSVGGALLASVCVDPMFEGRGVGKKLVTAFECEMWKRRAKFVYLTTDHDNNMATHNFYETLGWSVGAEFTTHEARPMRRYYKEAPSKTE
jgi:GNAT superfamily N-acetyltransferase